MATLTDKIAVVTGGGGGIGRATSVLLTQEGAKVVIADVQAEASERVVQEIRNQKRRGRDRYCGCDPEGVRPTNGR